MAGIVDTVVTDGKAAIDAVAAVAEGADVQIDAQSDRVIDLAQKWKNLLAGGAKMTIEEARQMGHDLLDQMGRALEGGGAAPTAPAAPTT